MRLCDRILAELKTGALVDQELADRLNESRNSIRWTRQKLVRKGRVRKTESSPDKAPRWELVEAPAMEPATVSTVSQTEEEREAS
jgi:orotate phosphoribosyltransferase-like protein